MIQYDLNEADGVLTVTPRDPLAASDFEALRAQVASFISRNGELRGLLIGAEVFPGWEGFSGLTAHLRFVRDHHRLLRRVAVVSDGALLSRLPQLASHFVAAEVRHFAKARQAEALDWLRSA